MIIGWSMKKESDLRRGRHCVFRMHVHLVFVTKYRRNVFTKEVLDDLKIFFEKVCLDFESALVEFDGEDDHVHLLVNYPPDCGEGLHLLIMYYHFGLQLQSMQCFLDFFL